MLFYYLLQLVFFFFFPLCFYCLACLFLFPFLTFVFIFSLCCPLFVCASTYLKQLAIAKYSDCSKQSSPVENWNPSRLFFAVSKGLQNPVRLILKEAWKGKQPKLWTSKPEVPIPLYSKDNSSYIKQKSMFSIFAFCFILCLRYVFGLDIHW